jgi:hypothetical protein
MLNQVKLFPEVKEYLIVNNIKGIIVIRKNVIENTHITRNGKEEKIISFAREGSHRKNFS